MIAVLGLVVGVVAGLLVRQGDCCRGGEPRACAAPRRRRPPGVMWRPDAVSFSPMNLFCDAVSAFRHGSITRNMAQKGLCLAWYEQFPLLQHDHVPTVLLIIFTILKADLQLRHLSVLHFFSGNF